MASLLGGNYDSSSDDDAKSAPVKVDPSPAPIVAAPDVPTEVWSPICVVVIVGEKQL